MGGACRQLTPWQRCLDGSVVCYGVYELIGIAVPPMIGSFLPKPGAVQIWLSNAKERKRSDSQGNFNDDETDQGLWCAPLPRDRGEEGGNFHDAGGGVFESR